MKQFFDKKRYEKELYEMLHDPCFIESPPCIQATLKAYPPFLLYKQKSTGKNVHLLAHQEEDDISKTCIIVYPPHMNGGEEYRVEEQVPFSDLEPLCFPSDYNGGIWDEGGENYLIRLAQTQEELENT